jgi:hypothetical protein
MRRSSAGKARMVVLLVGVYAKDKDMQAQLPTSRQLYVASTSSTVLRGGNGSWP